MHRCVTGETVGSQAVKTPRWFLAGLAWVCVAEAGAQTVNFVFVEHRRTAVQTDNVSTTAEANPWEFRASVEGSNLQGIAMPTVALPGGSSGATTMTYQTDDNAWFVEASFGSQALLTAAYATGNYGVGALGQTITPITLTGDSYPALPLATLSGGTIVAGVLQWNAAQALTISISGTADHMGVYVSGNSYNNGTESFGTGARTHTFVLPAASLTVGNTYTVELNFEDIVGQETLYTFSGTGGMGAVSYAGLYSGQTTFQVQAIPEPSTTAVCSGLLVLGLASRRWRRR